MDTTLLIVILVITVAIYIAWSIRHIKRHTEHNEWTGETTFGGYTCSEVIAGVIVAVVALVGFIYAIANR